MFVASFFFRCAENGVFLTPAMSVSLLTRMGHLHSGTASGTLLPGTEATTSVLLPHSTASSSAASSTSPPGSSSSLASFCSGSNFPLGNLSLHSSQWSAGSGARNPLRTSSPVRPDDTMHSASLDMIEAQLAMRRAVVAAAAEHHHQQQQSEPTGTGMAGKSAGGGNTGSGAWNPFSLLPFIHGAALASGSSSLPTGAGGSASAAASESALNAWSAAAAAAAAAYASLLPPGRPPDQDAGTKRRGESKGTTFER